MEDFKINKKILLFENEGVDKNIVKINKCLEEEMQNLDCLIFNLFQMKIAFRESVLPLAFDDTLLLAQEKREKNAYDFYEACHELFAFEKRTLQKIIACTMFCNLESKDETNFILPEFKGFCLSKLFELLPLKKDKAKENIVNGYITTKDKTKAIRNKVKLLLGKEELEKAGKDEVFDYNRDDYTAEDFCNFSKSQLVNIAFTLYQNYLGYKLGEKKGRK